VRRPIKIRKMMKEDEIIAPSHSQLSGPNTAETGLSDGLGLNNIVLIEFWLSVFDSVSRVM
jgi:hypothetical protein